MRSNKKMILLLGLAATLSCLACGVCLNATPPRVTLSGDMELSRVTGGAVCYADGTVTCNQALQGCGGSTSCSYSVSLGYTACVGLQKKLAITNDYPKCTAGTSGSLGVITGEYNTCYKTQNCSGRCELVMGVFHCEFQSDGDFDPPDTETTADATICPG